MTVNQKMAAVRDKKSAVVINANERECSQLKKTTTQNFLSKLNKRQAPKGHGVSVSVLLSVSLKQLWSTL